MYKSPMFHMLRHIHELNFTPLSPKPNSGSVDSNSYCEKTLYQLLRGLINLLVLQLGAAVKHI